MNETLSGWKNNFQKKYNRIVILKINLLDQKTKYLRKFFKKLNVITICREDPIRFYILSKKYWCKY